MEGLSSSDPFEVVGTNMTFVGLVMAAALFCCCVLILALYWRRFRKKTAAVDNENLSPYEKWMRLEEAKKAGEEVQLFKNESGHNGKTRLSLNTKDSQRLDKLHSKHGVALDREGAAELHAKRNKRLSDSSTINPLVRASDLEFDDLYTGGAEDFGNTWGDIGGGNHDAIPDEFHSMHNPMFAGQAGYGETAFRESAMADLHEIYGNGDAGVDGEDGEEFQYDHEDGYDYGYNNEEDQEGESTHNTLHEGGENQDSERGAAGGAGGGTAGTRNSLKGSTLLAIGAANPNALKRTSKRISATRIKRGSAVAGTASLLSGGDGDAGGSSSSNIGGGEESSL